MADELQFTRRPPDAAARPLSGWSGRLLNTGLIPAGTDARHVEAYIRVSGRTLGDMSAHEINQEVRLAVACVAEGGLDQAERVARSYGL
jgi:hypothetical protein